MLNGEDHQDCTITSSKSIVQVETLAPEVMERPVLVLLTTDMMLLCKDPSHGRDPDCAVELFAVLKLQTKRKPASVINGNGIRLVDNRVSIEITASPAPALHAKCCLPVTAVIYAEHPIPVGADQSGSASMGRDHQ